MDGEDFVGRKVKREGEGEGGRRLERGEGGVRLSVEC